jgi:hypothetical protein
MRGRIKNPKGADMKPPRGLFVPLEAFRFNLSSYSTTKNQKGGFHMKKIALLLGILLFFPSITWAQEKIEAPVWNVGDKWVFYKEGPMEVVGIDKRGYVVKFSGGIFMQSLTGTAIFDKSTFNILYLLKNNKQQKYTGTGPRRRIFDFPLTIGKQWEDSYWRNVAEFLEKFLVVGWEDVEVRAGKFKTIKLEYKLEVIGPPGAGRTLALMQAGPRGYVWYWYSPEVKNFVKCQREKGYTEGLEDLREREDWELASFQLKK